MLEIILASKILDDVINKNITFALSNHHQLDEQKLSLEDKKVVSSLAGCSLRHYCLFESIVNNSFPSLKDTARFNLFNYLSNYLFVKRLNEKDVEKYILDFVNDGSLDKKSFSAFKEKLSNLDELVPEAKNKASFAYQSIRYNTPEWLVRMWHKHYDEGRFKALLSSNTRTPLPFYRVVEIDKESFLKANEQFLDSRFDNFVVAKPKENIKKSPLYLKQSIFKLSPAYDYIFDAVDVDPFRGISVFGASTIAPILIELLIRFGKNVEAEVLIDNAQTYFETKRLNNIFGMKNVNVYEAKSNEAITVLGKPVHTLFMIPENSSFSQFRISPDFYFSCKQENMDSYLEKQTEALESLSLYVEENGYLIYLIPTVSEKEGRRMIGKFLAKHKEFTLAKQKQFYPFDKYDTSLYFAVLQKGEKHD